MARHADATEFPLHLSEVLEEELSALGTDLGPGGLSPWDFTPDQIRGETVPAFVARLRDPDPRDEIGRRLRQRLSPSFRALLETHGRAGGPSAKELREALAAELNRLLRVDELLEDLVPACRRNHVQLSEEMRTLLADPPGDRQRLLRLLLEEIFPAELAKSHERRLEAVYHEIHAAPQGLAALCLSGGGVRSAVFALGVLQGLARRRLLHQLDYLSTVSGGGYLGGLLSAWIHRHPGGLDGVSAALAGRDAGLAKLQPEPAPLVYLRNFSNYLNPKLGILSADSWTLISIFLRNLYLFWLVLVPLLLAVLALPRLYVALCTVTAPGIVPLGTPFWATSPAYLIPDGLFVLGSLLMTAALGYIGWNRPSGGGRSTPLGFLLCCLVPLTTSAILLTVYWAWYVSLPRPVPDWRWIVVPAVLINVFGWSVHAMPALARGRVRILAKLRELPLLAAAGTLGGILALLAARFLFPDPAAVVSDGGWAARTATWYGVFAVPCVLSAFILGETFFTGLASRWTDDEDREWWSRSAAWILIVVAAWITVAGVVIFGPVLLAHWRWVLGPVGGLAGVATALLARSSMTAEGRGRKDLEGLAARVLDACLTFAAPVFTLVLVSALSLGLSWLLSLAPGQTAHPPAKAGEVALWHLDLTIKTPVGLVLSFLMLALGVGLTASLFIDINKFSLHAMYRNRLIRTFLGASRENRQPNTFTGFDSEDNVEMWRLRQPLFLRQENLERHGARLCLRLKGTTLVGRYLSEETLRRLDEHAGPEPPAAELLRALTQDFNRMIRGRFDEPLLRGLGAKDEEREQLRRARSDDERYRLQRDLLLRAFREEIDTSRPPRPLHVVNVALNLVAGKKLAWQQRKAEPFTFSPLHCGSAHLGYRPADRFGRGGVRQRAVSLGTAVAISGASASPNMGYHSSPSITFLMTFFNARLGWWLGNPGVAGARTYHHAQPTLAVRPLISEALGLTDDRNPYVYLSDGGHFENLGIFEMVLRRCRHIVVVDAGQDHECSFEDLGNALRKIRIDLGIRIRLEKVRIAAEPAADGAGRYCALGEILYSDVDGPDARTGLLLYLKPTLCGDEPHDILHYKALNKAFPHESTGDQWFSESQFESYRALGQHMVDKICEAAEKEGQEISDLPALFRAVRRYLGEPEPEERPEIAAVPEPKPATPAEARFSQGRG